MARLEMPDTQSSGTHNRLPELIFVVNSGSSSLKFGLFQKTNGEEQAILSGSADGIGTPQGSLKIASAEGKFLVKRERLLESQSQALSAVAESIREHLHDAPAAVGHRMVHGGPHLITHQKITSGVLEQLRAATHFAPIHIPQALALVASAQSIFPDAIHIACFDDAFHRSMPEVAAHLPIPQRFFEAGVRRYGFHGLSYESIVHRLGDALPARAIFAHLGNGASLCAVRNHASIDTSMGLTPTGGIPMSSRSGDLDPGVITHIARAENLTPDQLEDLLNHQSGLFAISNDESDVKILQDRADGGDRKAQLALDIFVTAIRKTIGGYVALLGGVELLVFTGGIGEHSDSVRSAVTRGLECVGITAEKIKVVPAEEDKQIARHCRRLLQQEAPQN